MNRDTSIDLIYDILDCLMKARRYQSINIIFQNINPKENGTDINLAFLTASLPVKTLTYRQKFFEKCQKLYSEELLKGLE